MTRFERAKEMIRQSMALPRTKQAQRERGQYWCGFLFALVGLGIITRAQYAELLKSF